MSDLTPTLLSPSEARRLATAQVGIAGAGGLGSNVAMHLTRVGIGSLVIVDFDVVSESNLNRQFYFRDQLGKPKVEALRENLLRINPDLHLTTYRLKLTRANLAATFRDCHVLVEAFDNPPSKTAFLQTFMNTQQPLVMASGMAGIGNSNAMQLHRVGPRLWLAGDAETSIAPECPPLSPRVGLAAALQANTVLALLLGQTP